MQLRIRQLAAERRRVLQERRRSVRVRQHAAAVAVHDAGLAVAPSQRAAGDNAHTLPPLCRQPVQRALGATAAHGDRRRG